MKPELMLFLLLLAILSSLLQYVGAATIPKEQSLPTPQETQLPPQDPAAIIPDEESLSDTQDTQMLHQDLAGTDLTDQTIYMLPRNQSERLTFAVDLWDRGRPGEQQCDAQFWDLEDQDNIAASNLTEWYSASLFDAVNQNPEAFEKFGETKFFSRFFLNDNLDCDLLARGCKAAPSNCRDTVLWIQHTWENHTIEEHFLEARNRMIVARQIDRFFEYVGATKDLLNNVESNVKAEMYRMVEEFTTRPDEKRDALCNLARSTIKLILDTFLELMNSAVCIAAIGGGPEVALLAAIIKLEIQGIKTALAVFDISDKYVEDTILPLIRTAMLEKWGSPNGSVYNALVGASSSASGWCAAFGGGIQVDDQKTQALLGQHLNHAMSSLRAMIDSIATTMANNNNATERALVFGAKLQNEEIRNMIALSKNGTSSYERQVTRQFAAEYKSYALQSSKCFVECVPLTKDNREKFCDKPKWWNKESRACVDDTDACQASCWTSRQHSNRQLPLIKRGLLHDNISIAQVIQTSKRDHDMYGPLGLQPTQLGLSVFLSNRSLENNSSALIPGISVCTSLLIRLADFDKSSWPWGIFWKKREQNQNIPCTCGDHLSNETRIIYGQLGLGPDHPDWKARTHWETIETLCPFNLRNLPPLEHFLAFCGLGIRHPIVKDKSNLFNMRNGPNPMCEIIKEQVKDMTPREGNRHFCHYSQDAKAIFKSEKYWGSRLFLWASESHQRLCKDWHNYIWQNESDFSFKWSNKYYKLKLPKHFKKPDAPATVEGGNMTETEGMNETKADNAEMMSVIGTADLDMEENHKVPDEKNPGDEGDAAGPPPPAYTMLSENGDQVMVNEGKKMGKVID